MTTEMLVNRYLNELRRDGRSVLTLSAYATDLKQFLAAGTEVKQYQKMLMNYSPNSKARKLTTVREFLKWERGKGYIKQDLADEIGRPKRETRIAARSLSPSQIARLRRAAAVRERLLLELLLNTGMKLSDAVSIKMKHLIFRSATAGKKISQAATAGNNISSNATADQDIREIRNSCPAGRRATLDVRHQRSDHLRQALEYYLAAVTRGPKSYLLISNKTGRPYSSRMAAMILSKLGKRAGVKGVTPRNLRATGKKSLWAR